MYPLIKKGKQTDNFNDEDVWDLGWEFKHARLHRAFRVLQGSVTKRLLVANGMDLVRMTVLALIQLIASMFADSSALLLHVSPTHVFVVNMAQSN